MLPTQRVLIKMGESTEGRFKFLEHTTDAEIEAYGKTLEEAFENAALATEETMVALSSIKGASKTNVRLKAKDIESLLYAWLEEIISLQDTDGLLFSKFSCKIKKQKDGFDLDATCFGEKYDPERHEQKTAIKAPTYHDMKIFQGKDGVSMRFLLDL